MIIKGDVYIPLIYCTDYLSFAFGGNIVYDDKAKHLTVSGIIAPPALEFVEDKPAETMRENRLTQKPPEKHMEESILAMTYMVSI